MKFKVIVIFSCFLCVLFFLQCKNQPHKNRPIDENVTQNSAQNQKSVFTDVDKAIFEITTYDSGRILETGQAFLITSNTLVAPFSLFREASRAKITPLNGGKPVWINQFTAYDRINNIILLYTDSINSKPLRLYGGSKFKGIKTICIAKKRGNIQALKTGICQAKTVIEGQNLFSISNTIATQNIGTPVFVSNGSVLGMGISKDQMYGKEYYAIPAAQIIEMTKKRTGVRKISDIGKANIKRNAKLKYAILYTDYGNITIKLYNETPRYRDNFIQLAEEGFYDSLLVHRVIKNFGIQTGAADTRHAAHDDVVGWKGPGYTIPAHIVDGLYHKRGAIGAPRKPDDQNHNRRSDGSQFYIVTGRVYTDEELKELEKEHQIQFTSEQRKMYKTIGGAPHLDYSYTVFGEVISGIDIADRISFMPVKGDYRPLSDIRIKRIELVF